jgi:hypothetical protein
MFPVSLCGGLGGGSETEYGRNNIKTKEKKKGRKQRKKREREEEKMDQRKK